MIELCSNALIFILVLHISAINDIVTVINVHLCPCALILVFILRIPAVNDIITMIEIRFDSNTFISVLVLVLHIMAINGVRKSNTSAAKSQHSNKNLQFLVQPRFSISPNQGSGLERI